MDADLASETDMFYTGTIERGSGSQNITPQEVICISLFNSNNVVFKLFCYSFFQPRCIFMWSFHQTTHARCHCFRFGFLGIMKEQVRLMNMSGLVFYFHLRITNTLGTICNELENSKKTALCIFLVAPPL